MIITKLQGGIGNQMFQYAVARSIGVRLNLKVKCDISEIDENRRYKLDCFEGDIQIANKKELKMVASSELRRKINLLGWRKYLPVFYESTFEYMPSVNDISSPVYLSGYWQSEKYFVQNALTIKSDFKFKVSNISGHLIDRISRNQSVSVHLRRGDYVTNQTANFVLGTLGEDYYRTAINQVLEKVPDPYFYIFSDDINWVRQNFPFDVPHEFIEDNLKDFEQLQLMSLCRHHVIANSSFSWWAAWLGTYEKSLIIAPQRWFNKVNYNVKDLIPLEWSTL